MRHGRGTSAPTWIKHFGHTFWRVPSRDGDQGQPKEVLSDYQWSLETQDGVELFRIEQFGAI